MANLRKKMLLIAASAAVSMSSFAQGFLSDPKWGANEQDRKTNVLTYNYFKDAYNNKDYPKAISYFNELVAKAPKATQNTYIYGVNIFRNKVARATSLKDKNNAIDSLMIVYDLRAEHFGSTPKRGKDYILGAKARDYMTYKTMDREGIRTMFDAALAASAESKNTPDLDLVTLYLNTLIEDYQSDLINSDKIMEVYNKYLPIFDADATKKKTFDAMFVSSGVASGDNIEALFKDEIAANPENVEVLEKAFGLLAKEKSQSEFMISVSEKLYKLKPSAKVALVLAEIYEKQQNFENASKFLNEAIENTTDPAEKVNICIRIAGSELGANDAANAAKYAKMAIEIDPESAYAYIILAHAYAAGASACSDFDRQTVYWLAYDASAKARRLLKDGDSQIKNVDGQMATYRASFPTKEECFFRGLNEGSSYTVKCGWVSGVTTVRCR